MTNELKALEKAAARASERIAEDCRRNLVGDPTRFAVDRFAEIIRGEHIALHAIEARAEYLESVLAKVRTELLDRASIAAERKGASGDRREREYYSGQSNAFEMAALLIPLSGEDGFLPKGGE